MKLSYCHWPLTWGEKSWLEEQNLGVDPLDIPSDAVDQGRKNGRTDDDTLEAVLVVLPYWAEDHSAHSVHTVMDVAMEAFDDSEGGELYMGHGVLRRSNAEVGQTVPMKAVVP